MFLAIIVILLLVFLIGILVLNKPSDKEASSGNIPATDIIKPTSDIDTRSDADGLEDYVFLKKEYDDIGDESNPKVKCISHLYSPHDNVHYRLYYDLLHTDENKLSNLRVRLYEQILANPSEPLLLCSCCRRPVVLSGNSGIKGQIVGFRHIGEGNLFTGEHIGEAYNIPKQESKEELSMLASFFSIFKNCLDDFQQHQSFLMLPETQKAIIKPKYTHSVIHYWEGNRTHIKGALYIEKINNTYGILNLDLHRYPVLPIYEDIRLSDDKSEAELILHGTVERTVKL